MTLRYISEYRDKTICQQIVEKIGTISHKKVRLMEVCGTHTMSISRNGIRDLLPKTIHLLSGPGCPVCVTSPTDIDTFIKVARIREMIVGTFGDMLRVPGSESSLEKERSNGADIRIVYSPLDCLEIAKNNPQREVVFLGIGFETTAPTVAASLLLAQDSGVKNFSVIASNKLIPPALHGLLQNRKMKIDGFICPGHVSAIIGADTYLPLAKEYHIPCVVAGFEPLDIFQAIYMLTNQIEKGKADVEIAYRRGVTFEGNKRAKDVMYQVFDVCDVQWRGLGMIPQSGLKLKEEFQIFRAEERFNLNVSEAHEPEGCSCGEILCGIKAPNECILYRKKCTPSHPVGPCMVSSEGTCAAYYRYLE
ncbi:MAG: hydrogenase formation protein HypD [Thermodesulfobacteriota bacterium]|nr:hydrogenase formation protein HypD [Thermodesulfobacteriota bacterium]